MDANIAAFGLQFYKLVIVMFHNIYSYLFTDFYKNLEVSLLDTRN